MNFENVKVGFIGFGHMAQILCKTLLDTEHLRAHQIFFSRRNKEKAHKLAKKFGILHTSSSKIAQNCDLILFCVKPQNIKEVFEELKSVCDHSKLFISILAGTKIKVFEKFLGEKAQIMRVMPNVAAKIVEAMSVVSFSPNVNIENQMLGNLFFTSFGSVVEIEEKFMDIACGLSGSGIAFVYKLIEAFVDIGQKKGIGLEKALKIATQTFIGAAKLVQKEKDIQTLLLEITTKKGTTEAGLLEFEHLHITKKMQKVILESAKKSKELSD